MFRTKYTFIALSVGLMVSPALVQAQSLTDALIGAYRSSALLQSSRAVLRAADEGVAQAFAAYRPSVVASASHSATASFSSLGVVTQTTNLRVSAELMIWDGGATALAAEGARLNVEAARQTLIEVEQSVLLNAAISFMDMRLNAQFLELAENNMHVIEQQVQAANDRFEVGDITKTSVSQAEARFAGSVSDVAFRQGNLEISREIYFVSVGAYPGVLQSPPPTPRFPASLAAAKSVALKSHPSILRAQHNQAAAQNNIYRAQAAMKPKFTLSGNLNSATTAGIDRDTASISLGGSMSLYQGGALLSAERQAVANLERAHADVHYAGLVVSQNVARYWATTRIARASITARQKQVRAARVALRGIREEASLGARTTLDVLDAERDLVRAQSELVSAKRDEYVAIYSLLSSMGLLTVRHLKLGIKTYDEDEHYMKVYLAPVKSKRGKLLDGILTRAGKKK